jgi:hypothetical protein
MGAFAPQMPLAANLIAPQPIEGTTGQYMSPFTSDGVTSGWVTQSMTVSASGQAGAVIGQLAGQKLLENLPFGGMLGEAAGKHLAREAALRAIGGEEYLKSSSDLSFNDLSAMAVYMYANHSGHAEYDKILRATYAIYPDLEGVYTQAILNAPMRPAVASVIAP